MVSASTFWQIALPASALQGGQCRNPHFHRDIAMGLLEIILIVVIILALFGGGYGYSRRADWGVGPSGGLGLIVLILLVILLFRVI
jgi:hypothetical protein